MYKQRRSYSQLFENNNKYTLSTIPKYTVQNLNLKQITINICNDYNCMTQNPDMTYAYVQKSLCNEQKYQILHIVYKAFEQFLYYNIDKFENCAIQLIKSNAYFFYKTNQTKQNLWKSEIGDNPQINMYGFTKQLFDKFSEGVIRGYQNLQFKNVPIKIISES